MTQETNIQPGDLVFAHSKGLIPRAIRFGEWLQWLRSAIVNFFKTGAWLKRDNGDNFNHVAIIDKVENDVITVIQAEARGVTSVRTLAEVCPGGHYVLVKSPSKVSNARTLAFARNEVGSKYGFFTIASIVLNLLSPEWMTFRWTNSWICSAVSAEALRFGGWLQRWPDIYQVTPQQLYDALTKTTSK